MGAGLIITNTNGIQQVNSEIATYQLYQSGLVQLNGSSQATIPLAGISKPLIALSNPNGYSGRTSLEITATEVTISSTMPAGAVIGYRIFVRVDQLPPIGNYGLKIYAANGNLNFDSNRELVRIHSVFSGTRSGSGPLTIPTGYFVVMNATAYLTRWVDIISGGTQTQEGYKVWVVWNNQTISTQEVLLYSLTKGVVGAPAQAYDRSYNGLLNYPVLYP